MADNHEVDEILHNAAVDWYVEDYLPTKIKNAIKKGDIEFVARREEDYTDEILNVYDWEVTVKLEFTLLGDQENVILEEFIRENTS